MSAIDTYRVSYTIDVEATDMADAAEQLRDYLAEPGVPERGSYDVLNLRTNDTETIDFGEDDF